MKKTAIITIHGIHTGDMSTWQDAFRFFVKAKHPDTKIFNYEYGVVLAPFAWGITLFGKFRMPKWIRRMVTGRFKAYVENLQKKFPDHEFSILAHSFGTWITYHMMKRHPEVNFRNLVLVGGVISEHQEKLELVEWLESGRLNSVHAFSSKNDLVVGKVAVPPFEKLGYYGFIRKGIASDEQQPVFNPYPPYNIFNYYTLEDHGGVLKKLDVYGDHLYTLLMV